MKQYKVTYEIKHSLAFAEWKNVLTEIVEAESFSEARQIIRSTHENATNIQVEVVK